MPLVSSFYKPGILFRNGHFSTIYSAKFRNAGKLAQNRQRITLPDGDFIDLDFSYASKPTSQIAILLHGMEGNAQRTYMRGQAQILIKNGWDVCSLNYRGCSGESNLAYESYNAGKTDDLQSTIEYLLQKDHYSHISLVGFSLGGNLLLKYLGENSSIPKEIVNAVAISTPMDLKGSLAKLSQSYNWIYRTSFLFDLKNKYRVKMKLFPDLMSSSKLQRIHSLQDFDDLYTAPAHGFIDANDYYLKNSCLQFLPKIKVPILILNAKNDSFLSENCYPYSLAEMSKNIYLETPNYGGHVGFHKTEKTYYSEERALQFIHSN